MSAPLPEQPTVFEKPEDHPLWKQWNPQPTAGLATAVTRLFAAEKRRADYMTGRGEQQRRSVELYRKSMTHHDPVKARALADERAALVEEMNKNAAIMTVIERELREAREAVDQAGHLLVLYDGRVKRAAELDSYLDTVREEVRPQTISFAHLAQTRSDIERHRPAVIALLGYDPAVSPAPDLDPEETAVLAAV